MATIYVKRDRNSWRVIQESYSNNKRTSKTISRLSYQAFGINATWTFEEAKQHIKSLNKQNALQRKEHQKIIGATTRVQKILDVKTAYLPQDLVNQFTARLEQVSFGNELHNKRILSHWTTVCKLIEHLRLDPSEFSKNTDVIYQYFIEKTYSPDYCKKLLRILNMWGEFVCDFRGIGYKQIKNPRGNKKSKIDDAYIESESFRGESDPITPEMLKENHWSIKEQYNWMLLSVWFGLRPSEIDRLKNTNTWKIEKLNGTGILWIYQAKLTSIAREKRWKPIPCIFPEQVQLLDIIKNGALKRPLLKTIQKYLNDKVTLYGGRKGFVDLMLNRNQNLEDISVWLGHQSIEMTWKKYRNKKRVSWKAS